MSVLVKYVCQIYFDRFFICSRNVVIDVVAMHTVAIWTFPFHQNPVKKSDDFPDLTLAQYNLKK